MTKLKLPIIIALVAVAGIAGLLVSGVVGGRTEGPTKKHAIEPVLLTPPSGSFVANLKNTDRDVYLKFAVAVKLAPMDDAHWAGWSGANAGGHGGGGEAPGPSKLATYAKFHDAVTSVAADFSAEQLRGDGGRQLLAKQLLQEFAAVGEVDEAEHKNTFVDEAHIGVGPPYHVTDVYFTDFVIQ